MVPDAVLPSPPLQQESGTVTRSRAFGIVETWVASAALAGLIVLHAVYAFVYRVDSDEPQHLHVVWGWAHGKLQYRDLFDNHSPLFQMLCAPIFWAVGEHAWIIVPMRLAMLPLYVADLWLMYEIGRILYFQRWGVWMALVGGAVPAFFLVTTEFRTDDLWTTVWLLAVYLAVSGPLTGRRALLFGLTMGACFSVSMKTTLLLLSLAIAGIAVLMLQSLSRRRPEAKTLMKSVGLIVLGMIVIPAIIVSFFAAEGALKEMYYCVIRHNAVPGLGKWAKSGFHLWKFPLWVPVMFGLGWLCMHSSADERTGAGRALILMACGIYYFLLKSYWPLVTAQDFIPILPLVSLTLLAFLFHLLSLAQWPERIALPLLGGGLLAGCIAWSWHSQSPFDNALAPFEQNLARILHFADPGDYVMDGKGETIFRNRPFYWVLEGVTLQWMRLGKIQDDIPQQMIEKPTYVAVAHRLHAADLDWLHKNFLEGDGKVWIAGEHLGPAKPEMKFHTDIPGKFSIVAENGALTGELDGKPLEKSQQVAGGDHVLNVASGKGNVAIVWTQALDRGFSPFAKHVASAADDEVDTSAPSSQ